LVVTNDHRLHSPRERRKRALFLNPLDGESSRKGGSTKTPSTKRKERGLKAREGHRGRGKRFRRGEKREGEVVVIDERRKGSSSYRWPKKKKKNPKEEKALFPSLRKKKKGVTRISLKKKKQEEGVPQLVRPRRRRREHNPHSVPNEIQRSKLFDFVKGEKKGRATASTSQRKMEGEERCLFDPNFRRDKG